MTENISSEHYSKKAGPSMSRLETESKVYDEHKSAWEKIHVGQFVLIKGEEVIGFFPTLKAAFDKGVHLYGVEDFFVRQITPPHAVNISFLGRKLLQNK